MVFYNSSAPSKTFSSLQIHEIYVSPGKPFWQTLFHDRTTRDNLKLQQKRQYIHDNLSKLMVDILTK